MISRLVFGLLMVGRNLLSISCDDGKPRQLMPSEPLYSG